MACQTDKIILLFNKKYEMNNGEEFIIYEESPISEWFYVFYI